MIIQRRNTYGIGRVTIQIDTLHIILMNRQSLMQFCYKHGQDSIQLIFYANIAFIIAGFNRIFGFTTQEDKKTT